MTITDIIILIIVILVLGTIVYFSFIKNRKKPCQGCPYQKKCNKKECKEKKTK